MPALQLVTVDPPPPPANLPADLPGLTAAIVANLAEEMRLNEQVREEWQKLNRTYRQAGQEIDQRQAAALKPVRLERGRLLLAARALVPAGQWEAWCAANVPDHSQRNIRALIKLAKADDPAAAVSAERAATRARVAKHRAAKSSASGVTEAVTPVPAAGPTGEPLANVHHVIGPTDAERPTEPEPTVTTKRRKQYSALSLDVINQLVADAPVDGETLAWLETFSRWPHKKRRDVYAVFLKLTATGALKV